MILLNVLENRIILKYELFPNNNIIMGNIINIFSYWKLVDLKTPKNRESLIG